ncbi:MAG: LysM peptidoglycan-binding domain-containing protein [Myxococcota bacterium]
MLIGATTLPAQGARLEDDDLVEILQAEGVEDTSLLQENPADMRVLLRRGFLQTPTLEHQLQRRLGGPWKSARRDDWPETLTRNAALAVLRNDTHWQPPPPGVQYDIPLAQHALVDSYIDYFSGRGRWFFEQWLARAERYMPIMQPLLEAAGMPLDTIYLAMIESGFKSRAYSSAAASGFWQFIASTGRHYNLKQSTWVDERRDFIKATNSAIRYLKDLHRQFGDWHLAWAAYNAGGGRISRALKKYGVSDLWSLVDRQNALPEETRHYVPKIIAAAIVAKNRAHYGFSVWERAEPLSPLTWEEVPVSSPIELPRLASSLNIDLELLRALNPELRYDITPPGKYTLRVPVGQSDAVSTWLARLPPTQRFAYQPYTIRSGDTLSGIAHRFGSRVDALKDFNGIRSARFLRVGQNILIPSLSRSAASTRRTARARGVRSAQPHDSTTQPTVVASESGSAKVRATHRVGKGETLWSISRFHGVSVEALKRWNQLRSNHIKIGAILHIL